MIKDGTYYQRSRVAPQLSRSRQRQLSWTFWLRQSRKIAQQLDVNVYSLVRHRKDGIGRSSCVQRYLRFDESPAKTKTLGTLVFAGLRTFEQGEMNILTS